MKNFLAAIVAVFSVTPHCYEPISAQPNGFHEEWDVSVPWSRNATMNEFPFMLRLMLHFPTPSVVVTCSGTLLSDVWILTAAHCLQYRDKLANKIIINFGNHDVNVFNEPGEFYKVIEVVYERNVFAHPDYNRYSFYSNDFALIRLSEEQALSNQTLLSANAVKLPDDTQCSQSYDSALPNVDNCRGALTLGWSLGAKDGKVPSNLLRKANLPVQPFDACFWFNVTGGNFTTDKLCAGGLAAETLTFDACPGDEGGPLLCSVNGLEMGYFLLGIYSYGNEHCGYEGVVDVPAVYGRICSVLPWIKSHLAGCGGVTTTPSRGITMEPAHAGTSAFPIMVEPEVQQTPPIWVPPPENNLEQGQQTPPIWVPPPENSFEQGQQTPPNWVPEPGPGTTLEPSTGQVTDQQAGGDFVQQTPPNYVPPLMGTTLEPPVEAQPFTTLAPEGSWPLNPAFSQPSPQFTTQEPYQADTFPANTLPVQGFTADPGNLNSDYDQSTPPFFQPSQELVPTTEPTTVATEPPTTTLPPTIVSDSSIDRCQNQLRSGIDFAAEGCLASTRFYYNSGQSRCQPFSGCEPGRNDVKANNFAKLEQCQKECMLRDDGVIRVLPNPQSDASSSTNPRCGSNPIRGVDFGDCSGNDNNTQRFYWNRAAARCIRFIGCSSDISNNWATYDLCMANCVAAGRPPTSQNSRCSAQLRKGIDYGGICAVGIRFYFSTSLRQCVTFLGCQVFSDSGNNFNTAQECENTCWTPPWAVAATPTTTTPSGPTVNPRCSISPKRNLDFGECGADNNLFRFYFSKTRGKCLAFKGCRVLGSNNWDTMAECNNKCGGLVTTPGPTQQLFTEVTTLKEIEPRCLKRLVKDIDYGSCGSTNRYTFNAAVGRCIVYLGCVTEIIGNNFATVQQCDQSCVPSYVPQTTTAATTLRAITTRRPEVTCNIPPKRGVDFGACEGALCIRYYYSVTMKKCIAFLGCVNPDTTKNNFATLTECQNVCMTNASSGPMTSWKALASSRPSPPPTTKRPSTTSTTTSSDIYEIDMSEFQTYPPAITRNAVCSRPPVHGRDFGPCGATYHRYYYSPTMRRCTEFLGCFNWQDDSNNFATMELCEKNCMSRVIVHALPPVTTPALAEQSDRCLINPRKGVDYGSCPGNNRIVRYYWSKLRERCVSFEGCKNPSGNNFESSDECERECLPVDDYEPFDESHLLEPMEPQQQPMNPRCRKALANQVDVGMCGMVSSRFFYDSAANRCRSFVGCQNNSGNNFASLSECSRICPSP